MQAGSACSSRTYTKFKRLSSFSGRTQRTSHGAWRARRRTGAGNPRSRSKVTYMPDAWYRIVKFCSEIAALPEPVRQGGRERDQGRRQIYRARRFGCQLECVWRGMVQEAGQHHHSLLSSYGKQRLASAFTPRGSFYSKTEDKDRAGFNHATATRTGQRAHSWQPGEKSGAGQGDVSRVSASSRLAGHRLHGHGNTEGGAGSTDSPRAVWTRQSIDWQRSSMLQ